METSSKGIFKQALRNILTVVVLLLAASLLCELLYRSGTGTQNIIIVMVLAVFIVAALTDGYVYGILSAIAGVFIYDFLVTEPRFGFSFALGFPVTLSTMLLVTLTTTAVTTRIKRQVKKAQEKERYAELLYEINRTLLSAGDEAAIADHALEYLTANLGRSTALYTSFGEMEPRCYFCPAGQDVNIYFFLSRAAIAEMAAKGQRSIHGKHSGGEHDGYYFPVMSHGAVYGVFCLSPGNGPLSPSQYSFLELIVEQTAQALHVRRLTIQQQEAVVAVETEKVRSSFLRGISHDLRTPLTSIIGASATYLENDDELPPVTKLHLIEGIQEDSQWLLRMVENILSVTKLNQNDMSIHKTEEAAEEVVGEAVALFRRRHPEASIEIQCADELFLVPMDALLITQVLSNLLDNAFRHSSTDSVCIGIGMKERNGYVEFCVFDNGQGFHSDDISHLFEIHPARKGQGEDASRGVGIGLSICKTIVVAHGGWIKADNLPDRGAQIVFALPTKGSDS
ncbi:MAG: ATP-binding protein [Oscillospiraceae bacterium]